MIYFDNAATTKLDPIALSVMMPYMTENYGNASTLYGFGQSAREAVETSRAQIAEILGARPEEIYFTSGGSESDNQAILSAAKLGAKKGKKHIITSAIEHHAVLHTLNTLKPLGFDITYLKVGSDGVIDIEELKNAITDQTSLVTIMFANNEIGTVQPIAEIGRICRERGVLFHTDAVQAVGHLPINVVDMNIDMLSASAHKFHGPKGMGFLYCKKGVALTSLISGGGQEKGRRAGTENVSGILGTATALIIAAEEMDSVAAKETALRDRLIEGLSAISHSALNGSKTNRLSNNVNMCFEGIEGESLLLLLDDKGICASSGSACTSGTLDPSHVLLAIGRPHEVAHGSLRLTLSKYSTAEEVEYVIKSVAEIVEFLRKMSPVWDKLQKGVIEHVI